MSASSSDRNLLFGLLALQMDLLSRDQLLEAMHAWMLEKETSLGTILCRRGVLEEEDRCNIERLVERLVERHVQRHGGDARASLAALHVAPEVHSSLAALPDADVQASLAPPPRGPTTYPGSQQGRCLRTALLRSRRFVTSGCACMPAAGWARSLLHRTPS
jgi:hypothetical protein